MKYKCIRRFESVCKGDVYETEPDYKSESDIRLYLESKGNDDFGYIDITSEQLEEYFQRIE